MIWFSTGFICSCNSVDQSFAYEWMLLASVSLIMSSVFMFGVLFYVYLVSKFNIDRNLSTLSRVLECYKIISDGH